MLKITFLVWDSWNVEHIARHDVTPQDVEQSLEDKHVVFIQAHSGRIKTLGRSGKRLITTVLESKGKDIYYIVTARDMAKKERAIYRQQKGGENEQ